MHGPPLSSLLNNKANSANIQRNAPEVFKVCNTICIDGSVLRKLVPLFVCGNANCCVADVTRACVQMCAEFIVRGQCSRNARDVYRPWQYILRAAFVFFAAAYTYTRTPYTFDLGRGLSAFSGAIHLPFLRRCSFFCTVCRQSQSAQLSAG